MPSYQSEIMRSARTIARLQRKRRELRGALKRIDSELRHEKKVMRQLVATKDIPWDERGPATKVFAIKAGE